MAKRWHYVGDVNISNGGYYWQESGYDDHVYCVQVTPCSDAGGPDNMWWIEKGSIYLGNPVNVESALNSCGWIKDSPTATLADKAQAMLFYAGIESDWREIVQIGRQREEMGCGWDDSIEPDIVLRGNARLRNYVRREFLNDC